MSETSFSLAHYPLSRVNMCLSVDVLSRIAQNLSTAVHWKTGEKRLITTTQQIKQ